MRCRRLCASTLLGTVMLAGCLEPVTPPPAGPAAVLLTAADTIRAVGGTLAFTARAVDTAGQTLPGVTLVWSVSDTTRGLITSDGRFTAGPDSGRVVIRVRAVGHGAADSVGVRAMAEGTVRWRWAVTEVGGTMPILGGPALAPDGTIYVLAWNRQQPDLPGTLVALSPGGSVFWTVALLQVAGSTGPIVAPGTARVFVSSVHTYVISPSGAILWDTLGVDPNEVAPDELSGAATNNLLVAAQGKWVVAYDAGTQAVRWVSQEAPLISWLVPPTITAGGDVLAKLSGDTLFQFAGADGQVVRFFLDPDTGVDKRVSGTGTVPVANRYYLPTWSRLAAYDTGGSLQWLTGAAGRGTTEPAVGPDGTLYVQNRLFGLQALNPDGSMRWFRRNPNANMGWREQPRWPWHGGVALAAGGRLYAAGQAGFFAFDTAGTPLWEFVADSAGTPQAFVGSPAIAPDGTVYTFTATHVYAFWASAPPEPNSPWPMWRHDAQRTGWTRP